MPTQSFAFVRSLTTNAGSNFKDFAQIKSAEAHAKRQDLTSKKRQVEGRSHEANHFWSKAGEGLEGGGADYAAAYRKHKKDHGVKTERKGAAMGQHLLVGVSPEWLAEGGDPRDINNPRVAQLIDEAKAWAESWMGEGAVWGIRYDTDEKGAGVVDILASPIREQKHRGGSSKPAISVRKANRELAEKHGVLKSFEAMQTDWALHAQATLDKDLQRGASKAKTEREHVSPEAYAKGVELGRKEALETTEELVSAVFHISEAVNYAIDGTHDMEINLFEDEFMPGGLDWVKSNAPDNIPTRGFIARFEALYFSIAGKIKQTSFPDEVWDVLRDAFDGVAKFAKEVRQAREAVQERSDSLDRREEALQGRAEALEGREAVLRQAEDVSEAWDAYKTLPEPFEIAMNNRMALFDTVEEVLGDLDLSDWADYREKVHPNEFDADGDPPPVRSLIFDRAQTLAKTRNDRVMDRHAVRGRTPS